MINKNRYTMARSRSLTMSDTKDTVDHFITDRFIEIILDHKKTFNNALIIGDRNNFTQKRYPCNTNRCYPFYVSYES